MFKTIRHWLITMLNFDEQFVPRSYYDGVLASCSRLLRESTQ